MAEFTGPFFEVNLAHVDGKQIAPARFRTVQEVMATADGSRGVFGAIALYEDTGSEPVPVIIYSADGSIKAGEAVPDDDKF